MIKEEAEARAKKYVKEGWGSRAAVFHAIYDLFETDISPETCNKICCILSPFTPAASAIYENGRGYGLTICGALAGALAAFSLIHGPKELPYSFWTEGMKPDGWLKEILDNPDISPEEKVRIYYDRGKPLFSPTQQIVRSFKEHFGATDCLYLEEPYGDPISRECFRNCGKVIIPWTAGMVAQIILDYEKNPDQFEVDDRNVHMTVVRKSKGDLPL